MLKISIVTICYNEAASIAATMECVFAQTYRNIEYIVQDGGSTDGTVEKIKEFESLHCQPQPPTSTFTFRWKSARDGGLYNGMNAGLAKCTGDYVLFCNAGDRLASNDAIEKVVAKAISEEMPDLIYGDCEDVLDGKHLIRPAHGPGFIQVGMPASHEAMFYKLSVIRHHGLKYDTTYRITADYKFTYQFVRAARSFVYQKMPIVIFAEGGVSTANKWQGLRECNRVRKEMGELGFLSQVKIAFMQSVILVLATYAKPIYRTIRLRKVKK